MDESYLPGAASLVEQLDKHLMLILRDGRHLVGKLRSFDQYLNLILEDTCERVILPGMFKIKSIFESYKITIFLYN